MIICLLVEHFIYSVVLSITRSLRPNCTQRKQKVRARKPWRPSTAVLMSQRLSCISTDFGLQLIRTIASFFSSVFVCQRYAAEDQLTNSAPGLQESSESGVECSRMHTTSSSTSSFASSISNSSRFFSSSSKLDRNNPRLSHIATPPTIVLTTPRGHRHRKSNQILLKSRQGSKSRLSKKICFSAHLADFCNSHSDNDLSDSSLEDNLDMELTARQQQMEKKLKATEKELSYLNHKIVSFFFVHI